jgi:AcrR family transcriptional regulator
LGAELMVRVRAKDYDEKREAILQTAARMFSHAGVDRAPMGNIAKECGISKALLYHYYDSKNDLIFDIIDTHLADIENALENSPRDGDAEGVLRALCNTLLTQYENADDLHKVQLNALEFLPEEQAQKIRESERRIVKVFSEAIIAIDPSLKDRRQLLTPVTMSLMGMLNWAFMWFSPDKVMTRAEYANLAATFTIEGLRKLK